MVRVFCPLAALLLLGMACSNVMEQELTLNPVVLEYSGADLELLRTIEPPESARSILIAGDWIYYACSDGYLRKYDIENPGDMVCEAAIGVPSQTGYDDMISHSGWNSIYVRGPLGRVLESSMTNCTLKDEITICASPGPMAITSGDSVYLWIADLFDNTLCQFLLPQNGYCGDVQLPSILNITDMSSAEEDYSLVVATTGRFYSLFSSSPGDVILYDIPKFKPPVYATCSMEGSENYAAVVGGYGLNLGELALYKDTTGGSSGETFFNYIPVTGSNHILQRGVTPETAYLLTDDGEGNGVLYRYEAGAAGGAFEISVPGYPLDISISSDDRVFVLATE